jgi:hypothetical protein
MPLDPRRVEIIDDRTAAAYRRMTPSQRVEAGFRMNAFAREVIEANVRRAHPAWSGDAVRAEVRRRFAGD